MERSDYYKSLSEDVKCRYEDKLKVVDGIDPYLLEVADFGDGNLLQSLPEVTMMDLVNYLILTHSFYTGQQLKAFKSLQAFKFYESGLVQNVRVKQVNPNAYLVVGKSSDEKELENALEIALVTGYRHIDTAFAYGNEHVIGRVLKKWFDSGKLKREDIFLTTKCPLFGIHPDRVEMFMKKSLESLQLDYVDLYLLHCPMGVKYSEERVKNRQFEFEETVDHVAVWKKMEEQVQAGRAKTIGLSNFNIRQIKNILASAKIPPANLQVELHVFLQQPKLVKFCHDNNISVVGYSPLATPGYNAFVEKMGLQTKEVPDALNNPTVAAVAKKHGRTNAQVLLRFLLQKDIAVIPKSVSADRIKNNFKLFDFSLDSEDMATLTKLDLGAKGRICDFKVFPNSVKHPEYPFDEEA